jgi:signal transduction histidine kinase
MSEAEYKAALEKKGVHSFLLVLSTESLGAAVRQDLWLRALVSLLAIAAAAAVGVAWRNLGRSADLEVRLVRAAELNTRLKEMNLAAAGLAHETRNPLNIIRGLAQMIARKDDASPELRGHCRDMIDEADRLTAQLNEFINYSRPREVRRSTVSLQTVVGEVVRALASDLEDKAVRLEVAPDLPAVEADEQLLRQALFNLLLNAIQAVDRAGEIHVRAARPAPDDIQIDIQDNGPGVLPEHRTEIFKPYFTTHAEGTGLGLAVVQQIVLAHGWDILCLPHAPRGTILRIRHIRPAPAPR